MSIQIIVRDKKERILADRLAHTFPEALDTLSGLEDEFDIYQSSLIRAHNSRGHIVDEQEYEGNI